MLLFHIFWYTLDQYLLIFLAKNGISKFLDFLPLKDPRFPIKTFKMVPRSQFQAKYSYFLHSLRKRPLHILAIRRKCTMVVVLNNTPYPALPRGITLPTLTTDAYYLVSSPFLFMIFD